MGSKKSIQDAQYAAYIPLRAGGTAVRLALTTASATATVVAGQTYIATLVADAGYATLKFASSVATPADNTPTADVFFLVPGVPTVIDNTGSGVQLSAIMSTGTGTLLLNKVT